MQHAGRYVLGFYRHLFQSSKVKRAAGPEVRPGVQPLWLMVQIAWIRIDVKMQENKRLQHHKLRLVIFRRQAVLLFKGF